MEPTVQVMEQKLAVIGDGVTLPCDGAWNQAGRQPSGLPSRMLLARACDQEHEADRQHPCRQDQRDPEAEPDGQQLDECQPVGEEHGPRPQEARVRFQMVPAEIMNTAPCAGRRRSTCGRSPND